MSKSSSKKPKSLTALAKSLDTRKRPVPSEGPGAPARNTAAQRQLIERALREKAPAPAVAAKAPVVAKFVSPAPVAKPVVAPPKPAVARSPVVSRPPEANRGPPPPVRRSAGPAPSTLPTVKAATPTHGDPRRQYPRAEIHVRTKLSLADNPERTFEASLPTVNLSVGGMFLESSYFLRLGTKLAISLQLPGRGREVRVKGEVVRVESKQGQAGFAVRFTEYLDGSQVTLATHFLSPVLREFLSQYAKEHHFEANAEYLSHTADVLAAWELKKAELGGDVWDLFPARS